MSTVQEKNVFMCTRARFLKICLVILGAIVFLEYISGLLMDGSRTIIFYSANSSNHRNEQQIQWPKRTHGRHCFDDHMTRDKEPLPFIAVNNITIHNKHEKDSATNITESNVPNVPVNVHNATQRSLIFNNKNTNITIEGSNVTTPTPSVLEVNVSLHAQGLDVADNKSMETTPSGCNVPCPIIPPNLEGPISANLTELTLKDLENSHLDIEEGGRFAPRNCKPHDRVAIIIPYRDRESHLAIFLNNIHPFLMKQQIEYQIFIIEQKGKTQFNRASLMNVGFVEASKINSWDCFIFHDVDLIPLDDRNLYTCPQQPRHLSAAVDKFSFKLPYKSIFGGVSALTTEQFQKLNGFSNSFWGWGGEDDDMSNRISYHNYHISRYPMSIARYTMLDHEKEKPNQERYKLLTKGKLLFNSDGLNSLQYTLVSSKLHRLYTQLMIELHPPS